jgi:collagen type XVIII alpha
MFCRPHKIVWHGARVDSIDSNCEAWHTNSAEKVGLGSSLLGNKLLAQEMYSCQQKNIVLCIEVLSHESSNRRKRNLLDNDNEEYETEK